jgi:hypothetical protein
MQEPPMPREPSPVSEQLPISIDGQEPVPMSSGEVKLWIHDDLHASPAIGSNLISAGHTRPSSPLLPNSPATSVHRRITLGGRYKVLLPSLIEDDTTPIQSIGYMPAPSRGCSPCHPLLSLFPLTSLPIISDLTIEPSPIIDTVTSEDYSPGDAAPPRGHHDSHTLFTPSAPGGWM